MIYEKELPIQFSTWVEFYDNVKKNGLDTKEYEDVLVEPPLQVIMPNECFPKPRTKEYRYKIQTIKDNALEELLSERMEAKEFYYWFNGVEQVLIGYGHRDQSPLVLGLRKVKRIISTLIPR